MFARWFYGDQASPARLSSTPTMARIELTIIIQQQHSLTGSINDGVVNHKMLLSEEVMQREEASSLDVVDDTDSQHSCETQQEQLELVTTEESTSPVVGRLRIRAATINAEDMHSGTAMSDLPSFTTRPRSCTTLSPGASFHPPITHTIPRLKPRDEHSSCYHCGNQFSFFRHKNHCHYCGSVCCYSCTQSKDLLPQFGYYEPVSVCDYCHKFIPLINMPMEELVEQRLKLLRNFVMAFDLALETPLPEDKAELASIIVAAQPMTDAQERYFRANLPESPIRPAMSLFASSIEQLLLAMLEEREQFEQMLAQLYGFDLQEVSTSERGPSEETPTEETTPLPPPLSLLLLADNCVKVEPKMAKTALIERVQRLVDNTAREMVKHSAAQPEDDQMCRICCDAIINCVFLECGHMATCMSCAKRLQDDHNACPICRDKITRVVHIFRT
ncbi:hypothetical protein BDF22DRAFT_682023 [Syncephalis plumigaleata]|nr:hypothetical protein BDF22DRAFT_682023 [Syncephalis plumigaleata]